MLKDKIPIGKVLSSQQIILFKSVFIMGFLITVFAGCSSHPLIPEGKNVKVSRDEADKDCKELGSVQGSTITHNGTTEQALEDMKLDAARKGANYIKMEAASALGKSVSGIAYFCP